LLQAALQGDQAVDAWIRQFLDELRAVMFLTGARDVPSLWAQPRVITGLTREWISQLGYS
jgi:isopentenyl diphosphate isomerase/L-lactate dehydrogenase-like FMN-dependent dehydrogenase